MTVAIRQIEPAPGAVATPDVRGRGALRFLTCGSVDDGKSTLIGRLLHEASAIFEDQSEGLKRDSRRFGTTGEEIDFALLVDGLEAEREQGITIDVAYRFFTTARRAFIVADTPGHAQYTRNMATGASNAELAVLLIDARKGLLEQTRRHAAIVAMLGIRHVVLAINKIDLVEFSSSVFERIVADFAAFSSTLRFASTVAIPLSARFGDNVTAPSARTPWFRGPSLLDHLEGIEVADPTPEAFRLPVQWINRPDLDFRGVAGTVASGAIAVNDPVVIAPSGIKSRIARIVTMDGDLPRAEAGQSVTLTFADDVDVARGDLLSDPRHRPTVARRLDADLVWMAKTKAEISGRYLLKIGTRLVNATLTRIHDRLDVATLDRSPTTGFSLNDIGRVEIETATPIAFDPYVQNHETGGFILIDMASHATVAAGMIRQGVDKAENVHRHASTVDQAARERQNGHRAIAVWLTGRPGSGKSTIADLVERRLHVLGLRTMLLDGDNLRHGLNADLGFDAPARAENVRRAGEVARLMTDAGLIVLNAFVSPFRADRAKVAALFAPGGFIEVFVDASLDICRARDPKGLYAKAAAGGIASFTGIDQPYEAPEAPDLRLDTTGISAEAAAEQLVESILRALHAAPETSLDAAML